MLSVSSKVSKCARMGSQHVEDFSENPDHPHVRLGVLLREMRRRVDAG